MNQPVQLNFDASTVDPAVTFEALPANNYNAALTEAEVKETHDKDGHFLTCIYTVLDGEHKGRKLFDNLNLWNKSQQATQIAWRQMSALCHACGVLQVATVDQLFNIPIVLKVGIEQSQQYGPSNKIKGFTKSGATPGGPPQGGFGTAPGGPSAPDASAPWNQGTEAVAPAPGTAAPAPAPAATTAAPPWATAAPVTTAPAPGAATPAPGTAAPAPGGDKPPWAQ